MSVRHGAAHGDDERKRRATGDGDGNSRWRDAPRTTHMAVVVGDGADGAGAPAVQWMCARDECM